MDIRKLKAVRAGNRSAVTRKLNKYERSEEFPRAVLLSIYEELKKKWKIMEDLDEEIMKQITEEKETHNEILETDEYNSELNIRLRHFKEFIDKTLQMQLGKRM
jgi:hypothetical protein